jgi:hypothetical protein
MVTLDDETMTCLGPTPGIPGTQGPKEMVRDVESFYSDGSFTPLVGRSLLILRSGTSHAYVSRAFRTLFRLGDGYETVRETDQRLVLASIFTLGASTAWAIPMTVSVQQDLGFIGSASGEWSLTGATTAGADHGT